MRESLLVTGTIAAVAVSAAIVSAPAILKHADTQRVPAYPAPVLPTAGPLSVIASPAVLAPPAPVPPDDVPPGVPISSVAQPQQVTPVHPSAGSTEPATGHPEAVPLPETPEPLPDPCLIGLVIDPLLGVCIP